jgi:hypothetical protein
MGTHQMSGACHCGNFQIKIELTDAPSASVPRACDCDFCRKHGASYISDPHGTLRIDVTDERDFGIYKQGSGTANFIICRKCGVLIGATYQEEGQLFATINSKVIECESQFAIETTVSPKLLSTDQKAGRWKEKWFRDVLVRVDGGSIN